MSKINKKYKKALSLVEVLIVLAIAATSMIAVAGVNIKAQIAIKDNEIIDTANGIMIQALELAKSPTSVNIVDSSGNEVSNLQGTYKLEIVSTPSRGGGVQTIGGSSSTIIRLVRESSNPNKITTCPENSAYKVVLNSGGLGNINGTNNSSIPDMCAQVIITQENRPLIVDTYFKIESTVIFPISDQEVTNDIIGYRRVDYSL